MKFDLTLGSYSQNDIARLVMGNPIGLTNLGQTMEDLDIRH